MLQLACADVSASMPPPLAERMKALMIEKYGEYLPQTCAWVGTGGTRDEVLESATVHVKDVHALRSWPPEFWLYMRECIRES